MPGMLTEQPSSGPMAQTPPSTAPGAGESPSGSVPGPGQPAAPEYEQVRDKAVKMLYDERFDKLIEMFEKNGPDRFPRSMAIAINTVLSEVEKEFGPNHEMAAQIGMDLMLMLLEDIIGEGILPPETVEQMEEVLPAILVMYADMHEDVSKEDVQAVYQAVQQGAGGQGGAPQSGGVEPPVAAGAPEGQGPASPPPPNIPQGGM